MTGALWLAAFATPLVWALALSLTRPVGDVEPARAHRALIRLAPVAALPMAVITLVPAIAGDPLDAADRLYSISWLVLGTSVEIDVVARSLLLVAAVLYAAALGAVSWSHTARPGALAAFLLVAFAGNAGVYVAADTVTFYLAFAVMSFSALGLVLHTRAADAMRAGRVYLVLTVLSETAILAALLLVTASGGRLLADAPAAVIASGHSDLVIALLLVGFGVKAGLVPLHVWLPLAHPAAPPAASAVLSGAMVKAGFVGWLRFLPLENAAEPQWGRVLVILACLGAFVLIPVGLLQRDVKVVLAYSTISQMGFLGILVGVALASPQLAPACITAGLVYAVHHGLAKGALFLGVPVWKHHAHGRTFLPVVAGMLVASAAVLGAPFSSGSVGKHAAKNAVDGVVVDAGLVSLDLVALLPFVATGSTLLIARSAWILAHEKDEKHPGGPGSDPELWAWLAVVVASATLPWVLTARWLPVQDVPDLDPVTLWEATYPVLIGLVAAVVVGWVALAGRLPDVRPRPDGHDVPPGDLLVLEGASLRRAGAAGGRAVRATSSRRDGVAAAGPLVARASRRVIEHVVGAEKSLAGWPLTGVLVIAGLVAAGLWGWSQ